MDFLALRTAKGNIYEPTGDDLVRITEIADEKFRAERQGNLSLRSPKFDFEKHFGFEGGSVIVRFMVKNGKIENADVKGDFFSNVGVESLTASLTGCEFTRDKVFSAVKNSGFSAMGITSEALAEKLSDGI